MDNGCSERHRTKCGQYWPELEGSNVTYGMYNILSENIENYEDFMDFMDFMDFRNPFRKPRIGTNEKGKLKLTRIVQGKELFHLLSILVKEKVLLQRFFNKLSKRKHLEIWGGGGGHN
jgi:hypothetical protein